MQNPAFFHGFAVSLVLPFSIQKCFSAFGTPFLPTVYQRIYIDVSPNVKPPLRNPQNIANRSLSSVSWLVSGLVEIFAPADDLHKCALKSASVRSVGSPIFPFVHKSLFSSLSQFSFCF